MTCSMAAGKEKKRLISSTNSEQHRPGKKTKFHPSNSLVSLKPHIGLKWDQHLRRVVPEKEQVGISWLDLAPFLEGQKQRSGLADVTYVPPEIFSFENLRGVLSYEAWATCLTESERKFLMQFLPSETDAEGNVQLLLTGKNYHFRNPFLSWSSSLCYGDIHPDAVLNKERHIKNDEKAYRIDLSNYHSNMLETLKKWRKRWLRCGDIENLFSEDPAKQKPGVTQVVAGKSGMPLKVAQSVDVSKFMSYIEISRTQLNHIKRLKQPGDGIQTAHVSRVIGGLDKFRIKPYGAIEEGEQKRLREHWLNLSHNDVPAAFEVLKDRKMLMEKSRKLLGLEVAEKNVSMIRKVDQLPDITKELGQHDACENAGCSSLQNEQVEQSPQSMLQGGGQSTFLQDPDTEETKYMETSIDHSNRWNVEDRGFLEVNGTDITSQSKQNFDVQYQDQYHKRIKYIDESMPCSANHPDEQNGDVMDISLHKDCLNVQDEGIKEISYKDTSTYIRTLPSQNMQVQDFDGIANAGSCIHTHEQDQDLISISHTIVNRNGHGVNIPSENTHPRMATVITDQEEVENTVNSSLLSMSSGKQVTVEDFLDLNDHAGKNEIDRLHTGGPLQSYHPPENRRHNGSGDLQIRKSSLSAGQQSSSIYLDNGVLSHQQAQIAMSAFPVDKSVSFMEPFSNRQSNDQLLTAKDIGVVSYSLEHANSIEKPTGLGCLADNHLAQCAPLPRPLLEQQLIDQSDDGLYALHEDYYSGVSFQTKADHPISEQHNPAFAPVDHRYNWFPEGSQPHNINSFSRLESDNCLTQALPSGSNTDGTLFSAIAQYKQSSVHMGHGGSSPCQLLGTTQNYVPRTQDTNPPFSDMYGYTQNMASGSSSHVAPVGSLDNTHWTNMIQQNPGMAPDLTNRQFRGPWTR